MMNLIALSLIATSLVVSGLFSPNPQNNGEKVIVRGGHRSVVVEYGDDVGDGKTKVSISPPQDTNKDPGPSPDPIDEKISEAAASVVGVAQDVKGKVPGARPRELICDAYGKCMHKIAGVWTKAKNKEAEAEEAVEEVVDKAKDTASKAGHTAEEGVEGVRENVKEKGKRVGDAAERVKEKTGEKMGKMKGKTEDFIEETGDKVRKAGEIAKDKMGEMKGKTEDFVEETGEMIKEKGKEEITDIAKRGKEAIVDAVWYVGSTGYVLVKETLRSMLNVTQLLGFATAYGIAIWVTFINSHLLAGTLPRQQFGMVQSKIYPVYFKAMVGSIGLALIGHLLGQRGNLFKNKSEILQGYNLMTTLLFVLGNLLFLEPRATKIMFDRMKLEKEEGRGRNNGRSPTRVTDTVVNDSTAPIPATTTTTTVPASTTLVGRSEEDKFKTKLGKLDERLKKLNSYSSLLNIMTLMGLTWHLVYLSQRLEANSC